VAILAQSSADFALTYNFQGTHILGASRGHLCDSVASCIYSCTAPEILLRRSLTFSALTLLIGKGIRLAKKVVLQ